MQNEITKEKKLQLQRGERGLAQKKKKSDQKCETTLLRIVQIIYTKEDLM